MTERDNEPSVRGEISQQHDQTNDGQIPDRSQYLRGGRLGVLLVHGLGGTPIELRFIAHSLAQAGHTVQGDNPKHLAAALRNFLN